MQIDSTKKWSSFILVNKIVPTKIFPNHLKENFVSRRKIFPQLRQGGQRHRRLRPSLRGAQALVLGAAPVALRLELTGAKETLEGSR